MNLTQSVQAARLLPTPIPIVTFAWLEDSLHKRRRLAERKYTWEVEREQRRRRKTLKRLGPRADRLKFEKGCEDARGEMGSGELHVVEKEEKEEGMGFFRSALGSLGRRREAREKEEAARARGVLHAKTPTPTARHEVTTPTQTDIKSNPPPASTNATPPPSTSPLSSIPNLLPTFPSPPPTSQPSNPANAKLQDLYHIYIDATGFEYKLLLLRHHHQHNTFARYDLRLYESHSLPHVYCTLVRYTPPALPPSLPSSLPTLPSSTTPTTQHPLPTSTTPPSTLTAPRPNRHLLTPPSSPFSPSFTAFRHAFRDLTLLSWHERLETEVQRLRARAFGVEPYVWRAPGRGLPCGVMPAQGYVEGGWVWNRWGLEGVDRVGEEEKMVGGDRVGGKDRENGKGSGEKEDGRKDKGEGKKVGKGKGGRF